MHRHHIIPRSRGGPDEDWNFVEIDPYTHAYEHALDFVLFENAPMFDFRHEAWPMLPADLQLAVRNRHAENQRSKLTGVKQPRKTVEKRAAKHRGRKLSEATKQKISEGVSKNHHNVKGELNPFYGKQHSEESKQKMRAAKANKNHGK